MGQLMRSYRESFDQGGGRRVLTFYTLLDRIWGFGHTGARGSVRT